MIENLRDCLGNIKRTDTTHPALWLDKYMPDHQTATGAALIADAARIPMPETYDKYYDRWKMALAQEATNVMKTATVQGRLSMGLGGESVLETAISLHRTYGAPFVPGSALKGLVANYARNKLDAAAWGEQSDAYKIMFGNTKSAGYLTFFDALYVPGSGHQGKALWPDVITVHHPDYYQTGNSAPADWDSPTPVPFLTATGKYLIAIGGPPAWVEKAFEILANALAEEGIGAKTSSGYGRMRIEGISVMVETKPGEANASASPQRVETATRRGIVLRIDASKGGTVRENTTEQEFHFAVRVIEGDFPGRGKPVHFRTQDDEVVHLKRA
ncbi:MAG: type III-B CRISPR module RAMP protein Cmr6 [Anaerolineae bacterium]